MIVAAGALVAAFGAAGLAGTRMVYILNPQQSSLRMFWGQVKGSANTPGPKFKWPWETLIKADTPGLSKDLELTDVRSKDGYMFTLPVQLQYSITDLAAFKFNKKDPEGQMISQVENIIRSQATQMNFVEMYQSKDALQKAVTDAEHEEIRKSFGITLDRVIPKDPRLDEDLRKAIDLGIRKSVVAEGEANALGINTQALAKARQTLLDAVARSHEDAVNKGMDSSVIDAITALLLSLETIEKAAENGNTIITTSNPANNMAEFGALVQRFSSGKAGKAAAALPAPNPAPDAPSGAPEAPQLPQGSGIHLPFLPKGPAQG